MSAFTTRSAVLLAAFAGVTYGSPQSGQGPVLVPKGLKKLTLGLIGGMFISTVMAIAEAPCM